MSAILNRYCYFEVTFQALIGFVFFEAPVFSENFPGGAKGFVGTAHAGDAGGGGKRSGPVRNTSWSTHF